MYFLRSMTPYEQRRPITKFPSFSRLPKEIRDMIWLMALPSKRYIVGKCLSDRPHRSPALLYVNNEARECALKHYTKLSTNNGIRELSVDFGVDAFDYDTVDLSRAFSITRRTSVSRRRAAAFFQREVRNKVCAVVIPLGDLKVQFFEQQLCRTGFCEGLLPSLREIIFYVRDNSMPSAAKRKLRKRKLREHMLEEKPFRKIKTSFDKWVGECQACGKHNRKRSVINKALKLTFATIPGREFPSELVPVQEYPDGKYYIPVEWFL
jgi:hypothetical protein